MEESPVPAGQEGLDVGAPGYEFDAEARQGLDDAGAGAVVGGQPAEGKIEAVHEQPVGDARPLVRLLPGDVGPEGVE
jgi:hypothetical protein